MIPYSRQQIDEDDIAAVVEVLKSDFITQGPAIGKFESALASYCGVPHAAAASSGTACLHLACLVMGIQPGDHVWTSPISFVASANGALYCGAQVGFIDIDPATGNMDVTRLEERLARAKRDNTLPKLIIPVHFSGRSCDMMKIGALARKYGIAVLEDAAHALGASYQGKPVGSCAHSDAVMFSFHPVKSVTTGEGGALMTRKTAFAEKIKLLRSHGITRDAAALTAESHGGWYYEMQALGFHYRLTDIQAALGISQMKKLDRYVAARRALARTYTKELAGLPLDLPPPDDGSAWHLYVIRPKDPSKRKAMYDGLRACGIAANVHYIPIHLQPYYRKLGFKPGDFPNAEAFYAGALSIPIFPGLTEAEQHEVIDALTRLS
jgi:UDP-4-amino-4,6-dideoxy-N-acetyl-beta-L-altrosamine transaminase